MGQDEATDVRPFPHGQSPSLHPIRLPSTLQVASPPRISSSRSAAGGGGQQEGAQGSGSQGLGEVRGPLIERVLQERETAQPFPVPSKEVVNSGTQQV